MTRQFRETCILFGDVAGSTRLYDAFGDRAALRAIETCLRLMSEVVADEGGSVVKTIGDELMAVFSSPAAALAAAVAMQRKVDALAPFAGPEGDARLCVRIGFHFGPALETDADYFGDTVNLAARMVGIAKGCQIITTATTADLLSPAQRGAVRSLGRLPVKGKAEDIRIVEILWRDESATTALLNTARLDALAVRGKWLRLKYHRREWVFDADCRAVSLGRDPGNDVVVADQRASRRHATVERRGDKWVLVDHSTNGSFVKFSGQLAVRLHREELILHGAGLIGFGPSGDGPTPEVVRFTLP